jgi:pimeloyl-ACP methyl ester carboxylesterase
MTNHSKTEALMQTPEVARIPGAEERDVMLDGIHLKYWYTGAGPVLLLIHGFMGYSFSWRFNMEELGRQFSVYAIDLPGCGFSQRNDELPGSLASDAEFCLRLMDRLGVQQFDVLGTSRGGGAAILLAALAAKRGMRDRIGRVILNAPINPWSSNGMFLTKLLATAIGGFGVLHILPKLPFLLHRYFNGLYGDPTRIAPGSLEGYEAGLKPPGTFEHLLRIVRHWHEDLRTVEESLPALSDIPTMLLWGDRDTAVYLSSAEELRRRLALSSVVVLPGVGHMPYEEVPEDFDRLICDFLLRGGPEGTLEASISAPPSM